MKERVRIQTIMGNPEMIITLSCQDCGKNLFQAEPQIIGNQRVFVNAQATAECTTPCSQGTNHRIAGLENHLILPKEPLTQSLINSRLKS